jgi:hypothetical protein
VSPPSKLQRPVPIGVQAHSARGKYQSPSGDVLSLQAGEGLFGARPIAFEPERCISPLKDETNFVGCNPLKFGT